MEVAPQTILNVVYKVTESNGDENKTTQNFNLFTTAPRSLEKSKIDKNTHVSTDNTYWTPKPVKEIQPPSVSLDRWCDRMGGSTKASLDKLVKIGKFGTPTTKQLSQNKQILQSLANQRKSSHSGQIPRCSLPGYKFWGDEQGPNARSFIHHYSYAFGWLDDATNFGICHFGKTKAEVIQSFLKLKAWSPHKISIVSTDGAKEYFSHHLQQVAINADIFWTCSPPYVPQLNPRIEHWWYRTDRLTRYMLWHCGASKIFWAYAKSYACLIINIKVYGPTGKIPFEEFMKMKFGYAKLKVFGCTVCIRFMTDAGQGTQKKYNRKSQLGFYLGFDMFTHKHLCYGLDTETVHEGADFVPMEDNFGALHLFMHRNPTLEIEPTQELMDFQSEVESQGENFDDTKLQTTPFGISLPSQDMWKNHNLGQRQINTELPDLEMFDIREPLIEKRPEDELPQTKSVEIADNDSTQPLPANVSTLPTDNSTQPMRENDTVSTQPTREIELTSGKQAITREPTTAADPMEIQERNIALAPWGVSTRRQVKAGSSKLYDPTVPTSTAGAEVRKLAESNAKLQRRKYTNATANAILHMLLHTEYREMDPEPDELDLSFNRNCELAMHAFMVQGISEGGYWTETNLAKNLNGLHYLNKKRKLNQEWQDWQDSSALMSDYAPVLETALPVVDGPEPQSIKQLRNWPNSEKYLEATEVEMKGHIKNGTYIPCELPEGCKSIDSRFVYVRKVNPDNTIRYKARWVARGFTQIDGENFNWDTVFAPVLRMTSLRWLFSCIQQYDLEVTSADVVQAFLQSELKESDNLKDIYVKLPDGYHTTCPTTGRTCKYGRLIKALYGLKQSPRRWSEKLTGVMKKIGFVPHPDDPCIFTYRKGKSIAIYGIYVDDMIKATNDPSLRKYVDAILSKELEIEHQGELKEFLGMEFKTLKTKTGTPYLNVSQEKYCKKILARFGMENCNPTRTPCKASGQPSDVYLWPNTEPPEQVDQARLSRYRAGIGALIYLSVMTRPDISYAVNAAAQFMSNPNEQHEQALWHIFRYLAGTSHFSLKYMKDTANTELTMEAFVDANFMGDHDSRSVTGKIIFSGNGIIEWGSNRQTTIATSTSHAEVTAFFEALKSVVYVRRLAKNFSMPQKVSSQPTTMHCDNSAAVELVRKRNENLNRTKHWQMQWNWLHEQRDVFHEFRPVFREGAINWADVFTKPLTRDKHNQMVAAMKLDII